MAPNTTAAADSAAREGHSEPTSEVRDLAELDPLLTHYSDALHTACEVSEDPMTEEIVASLAVCWMKANDCLGIPAQMAIGSPLPPKDGQAQVTPPRVTQITLGADAPMEEEGAVHRALVRPSRRMLTCSVRRPGTTTQSTSATALPYAASRASPGEC